KEWLSQLLYTAAHALGGWGGMAALAAAGVALAFGLLTRFLLDWLTPAIAAAFLAVAFILAAPHLVARPHMLALPVMVAWVGGLARALERQRAPSPFLLPL